MKFCGINSPEMGPQHDRPMALTIYLVDDLTDADTLCPTAMLQNGVWLATMKRRITKSQSRIPPRPQGATSTCLHSLLPPCLLMCERKCLECLSLRSCSSPSVSFSSLFPHEPTAPPGEFENHPPPVGEAGAAEVEAWEGLSQLTVPSPPTTGVYPPSLALVVETANVVGWTTEDDAGVGVT